MPHPDSVLDPAIADFRQDFYDKLANMEAYTYDESEQPSADGSGTAGVEEYQPYWQAYNDAIMTYLGGSVDRETISDFLIGLYVYLFNLKAKGRGSQAVVDDSDAEVIFDLDGLVADVLAYPIDHYDDYEPDPDPTDPETSDSADNLEADTSRAQSAFDTDRGAIPSLTSTYAREASSGAVQDVYSGAEPPTDSLPPQEAWDKVFDELEWEWAFGVFDIDLSVPDRPEN